MLTTLMKYEFKSVGRLLLPLYGAWLIAAVLLGLSIGNSGGRSDLFIVLSALLYAGACMAAVILTAVILIQRFYKNLLGNEGYLMFALPVTTGRHVANKVVSGAVWTCAGIMVAILSGLIIAVTIEGFQSVFENMDFFVSDIKVAISREPSALLLIPEFVLVVLAGAATFCTKVYAAIAVGHQWGNHRVIGAILAYIGFGIIETIIGNILNMIFETGLDGLIWNMLDSMKYMTQMHLSMLVAFFVCIAITAIYWFVCWILLDKRLNLE